MLAKTTAEGAILRTIRNSKNEIVGLVAFDGQSWRIHGDSRNFGTEQQAFDHWRGIYDPETGNNNL